MFLVPRRAFAFNATVGAAEFIERLTLVTSPKEPWWYWSLIGEYDFVGKVSAERFVLTPVTADRSVYRPRIVGVVAGNEVRVTQRLHPGVIVGMLIVFGVPCIGYALNGDFSDPLILLAFFGAVHLIGHFVQFLPNARRVEARLRQLAG
jgi:hypothetical protein